MPSILVVTYDTSTGRYLVQKAGSAQIADGAITSGLLASGIVGTVHLRDLAVTSAKVADALIASIEAGVADGGVTSAKIASGAVGGVHIFSGSIPGLDLENQAITSAKIATLAVGTPHIAANAITSGKVASGGLSPLTSGKIWAGYTGNIAREEDKPAAGWTPTGDGGTKVAAADIEAAAGIPLTKLEAAVCSETEAAGLITTHAGLFTGIHGLTKVIKASDQTVNNSETLVNDADLVIPVGADDVWLIHFCLRVISVTTTPDMDWAFAVPAGGVVYGVDSFSILSVSPPNDLTTERTINVAVIEYRLHSFAVYIGGGNAGNLQLQWAQNVATEEDTKMTANSFMLCHRVA